MAVEQKARSAKTAEKRKKRGEEELRLRCLAGTKQALADLMEWHDFEEQGEVMTMALHWLHRLGPTAPAPAFEIPRHEISISKSVAAKLEKFAEEGAEAK
jgi:hypothetical protein